MRYLSVLFFLCSFLFHSLHAEILQKEGKGYLESLQGQIILHVEGSCYEMGYQHGKLLKEQIQRNIRAYIDNLQQKSLFIPADSDNTQQKPATRVKTFLDNLYEMLPRVPSSFKEEMKGLADGSDLPLEKIYILNLFPEMFHCSGLTVKGAATDDGSLYHVRVLDYAVGKGLQSTAVLIVAKPSFGLPFVNVSYAGFIGSVTGMNIEKIAIGEIGGGGYGDWKGIPMAFLMRQVLERATSVEEAKALLSKAARTCEYYYVISDGKTDESVGVYATASQIQFIEPGKSYAFLSLKNISNNYDSLASNDKFFLPHAQIENVNYQCVLHKENDQVAAVIRWQPQDCLVLTGANNEVYPKLVTRIVKSYGQINASSLVEIIKRPVAHEANLHNAIFHPSTAEIWVSHAGKNDEPACDEPYFYYSLDQLLNNQPEDN